MRISRVIIKNFRNFEYLDVELGANIILLGENGAGKTNFIEALRMVLDTSYNPQLGESDFHNGLPKFRGTEIEINVQFTDFMGDSDKDFLTKVQGCFIQDDPPTAQISFLYTLKKDVQNKLEAIGTDYYEVIRYGRTRPDNNLIPQDAIDSARNFRKHVTLNVVPALRDIERDMRVWQRSPLRRLTEAMKLADNPKFQKVAAQVKKATETLQSIDPLEKLQKDVRDRLTQMVEGIYAFDPQIGLVPTSPDELQKVLTLLIENDLSLDRASLGLANIMYLTLLMIEIELMRKADDDKYQFTILAVEEPESHLHPHLQRLVFQDFLRRNDTTLILSTHSPNIVSVSEPDWFLLLKRKLEGTKATSTSKIQALPKEIRQDLKRYLNASRGEVVFSRGIILVEGDAEQFLVPAFAEVMKNANLIPYSLDGAGISICSVAGTDFKPYVHFFGPEGLDLPLAIVTDGDKYINWKDKAKIHLASGRLNDDEYIEFERAIESNDFHKVRKLLDKHGVGSYEGLKRGIELAAYFNKSKHDELKALYEMELWDESFEELRKLGVFVNEWTLEADLIEIGYREEIIKVYGELGASASKQDNMRVNLNNKEVRKVIKRVEESGMGKGRFAQRLANKVDSERVPLFIAEAIRYVMYRVPQPKIPGVTLLPIEAD